jgi:O-glycosyl hydrolase
LAAVGTGAQAEPGTPAGAAIAPADITVDTGTTYQTIDGFGAALPIWPANADAMWTTNEVRTMVGTGENELGLSILRTMLSHDSNTWPYAVSNLREAKSYGDGVKILASPWTAPAAMKTNNALTGGGKLRTDAYDDYANHLNSYVQYMAGQGVGIDVVSVQNEPDWHPDYDSMDWSGEELRTFVRDQGAKITGTELLIAESLRFAREFTDPTLNDPVARNNIGYVGGHLYDTENSGNLSPYPLATQYGKNQWMTEWNLHEADGGGSTIWGDPSNQVVWDETLDDIMRTVHLSMDSSWSAYIWWYGRRFYSFIGDGEAQFGTTKGAVLKRGYAFSQYSKYVRPGDERVGLTKSSKASPLEITAYQGDGKIKLVILNRSTTAVNDAVVEVPEAITAAEHTVTSRTSSRASSPVAVDGNQVSVDVEARSISTVVIDL